MSAPDFMTIHPIVFDISLKTTNVNLMVALEENSGITEVIRTHRHVCTKSIIPKEETLTCWWCCRKSQRITRLIGFIFMNVCTKRHGNPSNSWDISVRIRSGGPPDQHGYPNYHYYHIWYTVPVSVFSEVGLFQFEVLFLNTTHTHRLDVLVPAVTFWIFWWFCEHELHEKLW